MSTPIEQHGGVYPPAFHTMEYPDTPNKLTIFVRATEDTPNITFYNFLDFSCVETIYYQIPSQYKHILLHKNIQYMEKEDTIESIVKKENCLFWIEIKDTSILNPRIWLDFAKLKPNQSIQYEDGQCIHTTSKQNTKIVNISGQLTYPITDDPRIFDAASHMLQVHRRRTLQEITIHIDNSFTPLCHTAIKYGTDKSVYNIMFHRHPYTAVYDMFLQQFQAKGSACKLGEIGVLKGASIRMWREYFPLAQIHAFDIEQKYLDNVKDIAGVSTHLVNAGESKGLRESLRKATEDKELFDILLEDASHRLEHQLLFLRDALDFVKPGGVLIIEDIFREISIARFQEALDTLHEKVASAIMIRPEHAYRHSPGWENDRMLFVWKK